MAKKVGYKGLGQLKIGQKVLYVAGKGDFSCEASAVVVQKPGSTGCLIKITKFIEKGKKVDCNIGDEILAGANELFL